MEKAGLAVDSSRDWFVADVREEVAQRSHNEESGGVKPFEGLEIHRAVEMRSRLAAVPPEAPWVMETRHVHQASQAVETEGIPLRSESQVATQTHEALSNVKALSPLLPQRGLLPLTPKSPR